MTTPNECVFSVDVETDWGRESTRGIEVALPRLLELLARFGARATFFVVGRLAKLAKRHLEPGYLESNGQHEVGSHGLTHRTLTRLPLAEVVQEVRESKQRLEDAGYRIRGFRAPMLASPPELPRLLAEAGYAYDCSLGSVRPRLSRDFGTRPQIAESGRLLRFGVSKLRDGLSPFSLTSLRLYHPWGVRLMPRGPAVFLCHLHELLGAQDGVPCGHAPLPPPLRRLHGLGSGPLAWRIVERLLADPARRFVPFRDLAANPKPMPPAGGRAQQGTPPRP